jgi:hypothetical protein
MQSGLVHPRLPDRREPLRILSHPAPTKPITAASATNAPAGGPPDPGELPAPAAATIAPADAAALCSRVGAGELEGPALGRAPGVRPAAGEFTRVAGDGRCPPEGAGVLDCSGVGVSEVGAATSQTEPNVVGGGEACVVPVLPVPQLHPSTSPSPIETDAAPVLDHVHPPEPLPSHNPQNEG